MSIAFRLCKAVFSEYRDGFLRVAGELLGKNASGATHEVISPLGLLSRPLDPDMVGGKAARGAGMLLGFLGSEGFAIPTQDPRGTANVPELTKGSTALYSAKKTFVLLNGETGAAQIYVGTPDGAGAHSISVDPEAGAISLAQADGSNISATPTGCTLTSPDGSSYIEVKNGSIVLAAEVIQILGAASIGDPVTAQSVMVGSSPPGAPSTKLKASL